MSRPLPEAVQESRQKIAEKIVSDMETKGYEWKQDWVDLSAPFNPVSHVQYKGGNNLHLVFSSLEYGFQDPRWMTFKQAKSKGWKIKKGANGSLIEHWKHFKLYLSKDGDWIDPKRVDSEELAEASIRHILRCVGYWNVFNAEQIEGIPPLPEDYYKYRERANDNIDKVADDLIKSSRCEIHETTSNEAYYQPLTDSITVPKREQFNSNQSFIDTLGHEMIHSTSHSGTPAERETCDMFTNPKGYAHEELIAELGSVFLTNQIGLKFATDPNQQWYKNHVAYIQSWTKHITNDSSYLFKAVAMSSKATDYLFDNYQKIAEVPTDKLTAA